MDRGQLFFSFLLWGGCLTPSFFLFDPAFADTIVLKNDRQLKGLVVEQHTDRIILSTSEGEVPILKSGIKDIQYDTAEQNFMEVGQSYEKEAKYGEALAYYEKAIELNPNFEEAKVAAVRVRNRFWSRTTTGPTSEIEQKQDIYDAWGKGTPIEQLIQQRAADETKLVKDNFGITLARESDWVEIKSMDSKKAAAFVGLKPRDRFVSIDGNSLRFLNLEAVHANLIQPRFSNFSLEFERDIYVKNPKGNLKLKTIGLQIKMEYQGLVISRVKDESVVGNAGLKSQDLIIKINGQPTRYMPLKQAVKMIESAGKSVALTIRRVVLLSRK